ACAHPTRHIGGGSPASPRPPRRAPAPPGHTAGEGCRGTTSFLLVLALTEDGNTPLLLDAPTVNLTFGLLAPNGSDLLPPLAADPRPPAPLLPHCLHRLGRLRTWHLT